MSEYKLSIREKILQVLAKGSWNKFHLRQEIIKNDEYTLQGFYKALTQLRKEEVVLLHNDNVSLSFLWIQNELDRISRIAAVYHAPVYQSYFGVLTEGQKVSYRFRRLAELHLFWTHSLLIVIETMPHNAAIMSLTPHDWFQKLRPDTNKRWRTVTNGRPHWAVLTHATTKEMQQTTYQDTKKFERMAARYPLNQKETVYLNVVGDLVFEAHIDGRAMLDIRRLMNGDSIFNHRHILDREGTFRLNVARNPKKAVAIHKKLAKYFTI